jgi:hypothetical protein
MNKHAETAIKGIYHEIAGQRLQILADLHIMLDHPTGVGDHAVHSKDIREKIEALEHTNSLLDCINEEFHDVTMPDQNVEAKKAEESKEDCCDDESCGC